MDPRPTQEIEANIGGLKLRLCDNKLTQDELDKINERIMYHVRELGARQTLDNIKEFKQTGKVGQADHGASVGRIEEELTIDRDRGAGDANHEGQL